MAGHRPLWELPTGQGSCLATSAAQRLTSCFWTESWSSHSLSSSHHHSSHIALIYREGGKERGENQGRMKEGNKIILISSKALLKPAAQGPSAPQPLTATQWKITSKQIGQGQPFWGWRRERHLSQNLSWVALCSWFPLPPLISILFLTAFSAVAAAELLSTDFPLCMGGGGDNYAERWKEARQPLCWTASFKRGPLPAVLQLQGSPVGLGICPSWGLAEMTVSARNESQLIFQHLKIHTYLSHRCLYISRTHTYIRLT